MTAVTYTLQQGDLLKLDLQRQHGGLSGSRTVTFLDLHTKEQQH